MICFGYHRTVVICVWACWLEAFRPLWRNKGVYVAGAICERSMSLCTEHRPTTVTSKKSHLKVRIQGALDARSGGEEVSRVRVQHHAVRNDAG